MNKYQEKLKQIQDNRLTQLERMQSGIWFLVFGFLLIFTFTYGLFLIPISLGFLEEYAVWLAFSASGLFAVVVLIGCYLMLESAVEHLTRFISGLKKTQKRKLIQVNIDKNENDPEHVIRQWIERFNAGDAEGLAALYAEDAINDQVVFSEPLQGREAIKDMFMLEFSRAKMVCEVVKIHRAGAWGILEWSDPMGLRGCGFFHIKDNQIIHQRGYFDQLTFFKIQGLDVPEDYLNH